MKNRLKLIGTVALALAIGFWVTGCPTSTDNESGEPSATAPASVTVTPATATVPQGGRQQFAAAVGPAGVSQAVTWTMEPADSGTIEDGLFTPTAAPGTRVTIRATATGTTVSGTATVTIDPPPTPASVTVTPAAAYVAQGRQRQFSATVGPEGAPQAVAWSVAPTGAGTVTAGGLLTVTGAAPGDTLTVTATAVDHPAVFNTATVTVAEPITVTVTGIPLEYQSRGMDMELRNPETGQTVAGAWVSVSDPEATFNLMERDTENQFVMPGDYDVRLVFWYNHARRMYRIAEINVISGANTIPWSAFTLAPPVNVTVTGIPDQYHGAFSLMALTIPGTMNVIHTSHEGISGSSVTFTFYGLGLELYDVILHFVGDEGPVISVVYRASSRSISTGTHSVLWSAFAAVPPCITITVTDIPAEYRNGYGWIYSQQRSVERGVFEFNYETEITGASATFRFWFYTPGIYDLELFFEGWGRWGRSYMFGKNVTTTTTISWSDLYFHSGGDVMPVTVTGIPERYHGNWGELILYVLGTSNRVIGSLVHPVNASTTFRLSSGGRGSLRPPPPEPPPPDEWPLPPEPDEDNGFPPPPIGYSARTGAAPGIFDTVLWLGNNRYTLSSEPFYAGASIPFGRFAPSP